MLYREVAHVPLTPIRSSQLQRPPQCFYQASDAVKIHQIFPQVSAPLLNIHSTEFYYQVKLLSDKETGEIRDQNFVLKTFTKCYINPTDFFPSRKNIKNNCV